MLALHGNVTTAEQRWEKLVADFRQLCLLRRQKKWIESDIVLNSDLPRSIASWSEVFDAEPASKKSRLDAMFQAEQRRIDESCFAMELVTCRLEEEILPSMCARITEQVRAAVFEEVRTTLLEQVRSTILEEVRASLGEQIRAAVAAEIRAHPPQPTQLAPLPESAPAPARAAAKNNLLSDFAEQVRSTVAQQACAAVLEELARDHKPAAPTRTSEFARARGRIPFDDIPGVIDFVLAEEQHSIKNKYKFELSACP
jgi:hypothetical protein